MHRGTAHVAHLVGFDVIRQLSRDIAGAIVAEQPWACYGGRGAFCADRGSRFDAYLHPVTTRCVSLTVRRKAF